MALDPDAVETVTLDSYGTVVDVDGVERALADRVADPRSVSRLWRYRSLTYATTSNVVGNYRPFYGFLRDSLSYALAAHGEDLPAEEREAILERYHDLPAFDDVRPALERLTAAGYDVYVVSNGNPEMLDSMVEGADLGGLLAGTVSAHEVRTFKPAPEIYRHAAARTGTPIDRICHCSSLWFDVQGAAHAGARTAWVNRDGGPADPFGADPDRVAPDFHAVADALGA
jgi:2-haloacid dehalogenase